MAVLGLFALPAVLSGQPRGAVSLFVDRLPAQKATELRARVSFEHTFVPRPAVRVRVAGYGEGLLADRLVGSRPRGVAEAIVRAEEFTAELAGERIALDAGFGRIVWGRIDEVPPGDLVNPIDVARFLFHGRSAARRSVWFARTRLFLPGETVVEGVLVPVFRRGRFDELDEAHSPFNLRRDVERTLVACQGVDVCPPVRLLSDEPPVSWRTLQGGVRIGATSRRVDWAVALYRGFKAFGLVEPVAGVGFVERFPRFTVATIDGETVRGPWAVRGEAALFVEDHFPQAGGIGIVRGRAVEAAGTVDRRAGAYRLGAGALVRRQVGREPVGTILLIGAAFEAPKAQPPFLPGAAEATRTDATVLGFAEGRFARETRRVRSFLAWNPAERHAFLRFVVAISPQDNVWVEASAGWFAGEGSDLLGRFATRDFVHASLRIHF